MMRLLSSNWTAAIAGVIIYVVSTLAFWKTPEPQHIALESAATDHTTGPSWEFTNPEADQLIAELKVEKKGLEKREQQLNDLAVRLDAERVEVNLATEAVHKLQDEFDKNVVRVRDEETANLKKLAKVYAAMTPDSAATVLAQLDDAAIVKILVFMKDDETAAVLESLSKKGAPEAKRVAALSESLRLSAFRNNTAK